MKFPRPLKKILGLGLIAFFLARLTGWRRYLYHKGFFTPRRLSEVSKAKLVSVGNLSFGGSGKTPFVAFLANHLLERGIPCGIVSRNYGATLPFNNRTEFSPVDISHPNASLVFGDEPSMLSKKLISTPVWVGPKKWKTALALASSRPDLKVVLLDDGFQHLRLAKDFEIVLLDMTEPSALDIFPLGRGRESVDALIFSDWIILTKVNWALPHQKEKVMSCLPKGKPFSLVNYELRWPEACLRLLQIRTEKKLLVLCAIGNPEPFLREIRSRWRDRVFDEWTFQDHHHYSSNQILEIEKVLLERDLILITTEKDFVKLERRLSEPVLRRVFYPQVVVTFCNEKDPFFHRLNQLLDL